MVEAPRAFAMAMAVPCRPQGFWGNTDEIQTEWVLLPSLLLLLFLPVVLAFGSQIPGGGERSTKVCQSAAPFDALLRAFRPFQIPQSVACDGFVMNYTLGCNLTPCQD